MRTSFLLIVVSLGFLTGCSGPPSKPAPAKAHDEHAHPSKGPNGGELVELGDEEFHAELVVNEKTDEVSIYILDNAAKSAVAIDAKEIVINLKHDGKPEQHVLAAAPQATDGAGKSSRFVAKEGAELHGDLEHKGADARLQVTINGKAFSGKIAHEDGDHKHDEKGHKH